MPIDKGMGGEVVFYWMGAFMAYHRMSPTHPDRGKILLAAERAVTEGYSPYLPNETNPLDAANEPIHMASGDVTEVLNAVAIWLTNELDDDALDALGATLDDTPMTRSEG